MVDYDKFICISVIIIHESRFSTLTRILRLKKARKHIDNA